MPELDRRDFLKLVGASAGAAAATGCSDPVEKLIPYVIQPEEITPGIAVIYASTCRECPAACGLHVRTREGRPVKLEGNPEHPTNKGALCARGQAGIGRTYHPDRYAGPQIGGEAASWEDAVAKVAGAVRKNPGGTYVLGGDVGPTANRAIDRWLEAVGAGGRVVYETFAPEALRAATRALYGEPLIPHFDLSDADLIIDFGSECLESGPSPTAHARQLAEARKLDDHGGARFVYVGPRLSMTAGSADEWVTAKPGTEGLVALAIAQVAVRAGGGDASALSRLGRVSPQDAAEKAGVTADQIERLGRAVAKARNPVALPPGPAVSGRRAVACAAAVLAFNQAMGAVGRTVQLEREPEGRARVSHREVLRLVEAMNSGKVSVLIVHDADPVYSLPAASGFAEALGKVELLVSTASMPDETAARAHVVLPDHTPLESWGDAEARDGVRSLLQPTVRPLTDTQALVDTLHAVGRQAGAPVPDESFKALVEEAWASTDFRAALAKGGSFSTPTAVAAGLSGSGRLEVDAPMLEGEGDLVLMAYPHAFLYDGRGANLPWLQEVPDPVTKIAWQSWAEISETAAGKLGVGTGDVLKIETTAGAIEVPALVRGGIRDDVIAIPTGQGHTHGYYASLAGDGQPGEARGSSVISVLPSVTDENGGRAWLTANARVTPTGGFQRVPIVQASDNKRERMLGESLTLATLTGHGEADAPAGGHHGANLGPVYAREHGPIVEYDAAKDAEDGSLHRWGMAIDLDKCNGCSACVAACYIENNLPVVGEEGVRRGRVMSWLRINRWPDDGAVDYLDSDGRNRRLLASREKLGETDIRHSPQLCQQCGAAPCEPVCPALATMHNREGLNAMVYNRCLGTRYCSNNCPYKVRRFNYFDYSQHNWPGLMGLMLNPDVTVRAQGVMEKCTFCVQRIEGGRQLAMDEGRAIADGEVTTACAQACPTEAITFGNLRDPGSRVSKKADDDMRGYRALHSLNTRPAITYLAKVKRGSVEG